MVPGTEFENCNPIKRGEESSGYVVVVLLMNGKGDAGVSSGEAGLEGFFEEDEIWERTVTIRLVARSKPDGVRGWKPSSGLERTERQSSQGRKVECSAA